MVSVSAGGEHTLYARHDTAATATIGMPSGKRLYSTGACGLGWCRLLPMTPGLFWFQPVPLPEPVRLFFASYYHNLAVGKDTGRLYSWGCGTFTDGDLDGVIPALGQGTANAEDKGGLPKVIHDDATDPVVDIAGGAYHSIILKQSGALLTFGAGQLGQLSRPTSMTDASGLPVDSEPKPVRGLPAEEKVASIGSAFYNTFAVCQSGRLYCAGENQNEQCGKGPKNLMAMTRVAELDGERIEQVQGGYCHTLIKTLEGKVFSLGCGDDGQRGDGRPLFGNDEEDDDEDTGNVHPPADPRPVVSRVLLPNNEQARTVAAGANHSVVLSTMGSAYAFGANDVGQCGVASTDGEPLVAPTKVILPAEAGSVEEVSAGYAHTILTTDKGKVFVFGQNDNGQLGLDSDIVSNGQDPEPKRTPVQVALSEREGTV